MVPTASDEVTIAAGATVTIDVAASCAALTIANTASLLTSTTTPYQLQVAGSITNNGTLDLSNANFTMLGQLGSPTVNGLLHISAGTYNIGTASGNSLGFGAGAVYNQEGGTVNIAGRLNTPNAITFSMSGGALNVVTVGNASTSFSFSLSSNTPANTQTISGGTFTLVQPNSNANVAAADYYVLGVMTYTGGTVRIGSDATTAPATGTATFRLAGNTPNLVIDGSTTPKTALLAAQLVVRGTTLAQATFTLDLNGYRLLQAGPTLTNNGTFTATTGASGTTIPGSRLYFQSAAATAAPTLATGATAGAFTSTAGLTLNAATGIITPGTSTPGTYTITNTVAGAGS